MAREALEYPVIGEVPTDWDVYRVTGLLNGTLGARVNLTAYEGTSHNLDINSVDTSSGKILRGRSGGSTILDVDKNGLTLTGTLAVTGGITATGNLAVNGNATLGDGAGDAHTVNGAMDMNHTLNVDGAVTMGSSLAVNGNVTLGDFSTDVHAVNGNLDCNHDVNVDGTLTATGNVKFDDASDTFNLDATNNRVRVGVDFANATSRTNEKLTVGGGRLFLEPNSEDKALIFKYSETSGFVALGATNSATPDLRLTNNGGTQLGMWLTTGCLIVGTATGAAGSELLRVQGASRFEGALTVTTGGAAITGNSSVTGTFTSSSTLTVTAGGLTVTAGGATVTAGGLRLDGQTVALGAGAAVLGNYRSGGTAAMTGWITINLDGNTRYIPYWS